MIFYVIADTLYCLHSLALQLDRGVVGRGGKGASARVIDWKLFVTFRFYAQILLVPARVFSPKIFLNVLHGIFELAHF